MNEPQPLPRQSDRLLGSQWRDEHGNEFRITGISYRFKGDDPEIKLAYIPPDRKTLRLSEIEETHVQTREGYRHAGS